MENYGTLLEKHRTQRLNTGKMLHFLENYGTQSQKFYDGKS